MCWLGDMGRKMVRETHNPGWKSGDVGIMHVVRRRKVSARPKVSSLHV